MKTADVAGMLLCMAIGTAYADKEANTNDHQNHHHAVHQHAKSTVKKPTVAPKGSEKKENQTKKDATELPTIGNLVDNAFSVKKQ